jgi:hypothetical protein
VNNRKSFSFSSEAFAGMRITYRHQKEAKPESQHDDIQHEVLLVALVSGATVTRSGKEDCDGSRTINVYSHRTVRLPRRIYVFEVGVTATLYEINKCWEVLTEPQTIMRLINEAAN